MLSVDSLVVESVDDLEFLLHGVSDDASERKSGRELDLLRRNWSQEVGNHFGDHLQEKEQVIKERFMAIPLRCNGYLRKKIAIKAQKCLHEDADYTRTADGNHSARPLFRPASKDENGQR